MERRELELKQQQEYAKKKAEEAAEALKRKKQVQACYEFNLAVVANLKKNVYVMYQKYIYCVVQ